MEVTIVDHPAYESVHCLLESLILFLFGFLLLVDFITCNFHNLWLGKIHVEYFV